MLSELSARQAGIELNRDQDWDLYEALEGRDCLAGPGGTGGGGGTRWKHVLIKSGSVKEC